MRLVTAAPAGAVAEVNGMPTPTDFSLVAERD
jgi:hypothetical protein